MKLEEPKTSQKSSSKPIVSSRLPKAFSQPNHLHKKFLKNHNELAAANEYKLARKLLSPIKIETPLSTKHKGQIYNFQIEASLHLLAPCKVRIQDLITLEVISSGGVTMRKVLHAPSLKLYSLKQVPVNTLSTRKNLLDTLRCWQKYQRRCRHLVRVNSTFWNSPEGSVSVVMDHLGGTTLARLCENLGAIPESLLSTIAVRMLSALSYLHKKNCGHGALDLNHILITREAKARLSIGLESSELGLAEDIKELGLTLIKASLGEEVECPEQGDCCIFHTLVASPDNVLLTRLSKNFQSFLCKATHYTTTCSANELISHSWIDTTDNCVVSLKELLTIGLQPSFPSDLGAPGQKQLKNLTAALTLVLPTCSTIPTLSDSLVSELAFELGIQKEIVHETLEQVLSDSLTH